MSDDLFARLAAPFPPDRVSWRVGSVTKDKTKAMALAFIDARDVMGRLDEVCTPAHWQRRHPHVDKTTTCEIDIWFPELGWVTKSDGAGDTAVEAEKGSLSDSFKRAAVNWGVGRYLYDLPSPWVEIDEYKRIKQTELIRLRDLLSRDATPRPATAKASATKTTGAAAPTPPTLAQRADRLESAMRAQKTRDALRKAYSLASGLCAELDEKDPERLGEIEELYQTLFDRFDGPKADEFGLNGDTVPAFA